MEGDVQHASFAATPFDAHVLATMPRDASARNGGGSVGASSSSTMYANAPYVAGGRSQPPTNVVRYLLKQEVVTTVGIALRANQGSVVTQQLIGNVLSVMEQLQSYAPMYFPGTGGLVQPQQQQDVARHFIGSEAGDEVGESGSSAVDAKDV